MSRFLGFALITIAASLFCGLLMSAQETRKSNFDSVLGNFPGYHLLSLRERDPDARAFILEHFPKANPSVVHADFDGDGHLDYALLLKDSKSEATKLVVLLCSGDGQCQSVYDLDIATQSGSTYIRPVSAGSRVSQTEAIDTGDSTSPVKLKFTGVRVTYFGQGEIVLYWNAKLRKMEAVQTKD